MANYFLRSDGDDAADGMSEATAWRTLRHLSAFLPQPGDVIRLRGGDTFEGSLHWGAWNVGSPTGRILVSSYGNGVPTIRPAPEVYALHYSGPGGLTFEKLRLIGQVTQVADLGGLHVSAMSGGTTDIEIRDIEAQGFGAGVFVQGGGIVADRVRNVTVERCHLHHNTNGLWLSAVEDVYVAQVNCHHNDWLGVEAGDRVHGGSGAMIGFAERVTVQDSQFNHNGLRTFNCGGHTGLTALQCTRTFLDKCLFRGNGDPVHGDGQGAVFHGCSNSKMTECVAIDNLNGLSLFEDRSAPAVVNCEIRRCVATGNVSDLSLHGTIQGAVVTGNQFLATGPRSHKAFDVADDTPETVRSNIRVFNNVFRIGALSNQLLLEAAGGLEGVELLEANRWEGPQVGHIFSVRGRGFDTILEALAAVPA